MKQILRAIRCVVTTASEAGLAVNMFSSPSAASQNRADFFDFYFAGFSPTRTVPEMSSAKAALRDAIIAQLRADLALQIRAAQLARDEAISEESRAENKYDTHSQEAAYLAEGQARQAAEVEESISLYQSMPLSDLSNTDAIALGALVEVSSGTRTAWYFVGPRGGGLELVTDGKSILVLTPQSPLGRQLLGRRVGDTVRPPGRGTAAQEQRIVSIR
jgi:transcription elongation GreA/GreB family factor